MSRQTWDPRVHGLSYSALNTWLVDKEAANVQYLLGYRPVQAWNHKMCYGNLVQSGIEGFIKTQSIKGAYRFITNQQREYTEQFGNEPDILWWSKLAMIQVEAFVSSQRSVLEQFTDSERNYRPEIELPSGRKIVLNSYLDGEGFLADGMPQILENKVRGKIKSYEISEFIQHDLQLNIYLFCYYQVTGVLPRRVVYYTQLRPGDWGYRGPKKRKSETVEGHLSRIEEHIKENPEYYVYKYNVNPTLSSVNKFAHGCLYPMLESFLDWYEYMTGPKTEVNKYHWMSPYGTYSPFTMDVEENFRNFRINGTFRGLVKQ